MWYSPITALHVAHQKCSLLVLRNSKVLPETPLANTKYSQRADAPVLVYTTRRPPERQQAYVGCVQPREVIHDRNVVLFERNLQISIFAFAQQCLRGAAESELSPLSAPPAGPAGCGIDENCDSVDTKYKIIHKYPAPLSPTSVLSV